MQAVAGACSGDEKSERLYHTPQDLQSGNLFHQLTVQATHVHRLRSQRRTARLLGEIKAVQLQWAKNERPFGSQPVTRYDPVEATYTPTLTTASARDSAGTAGPSDNAESGQAVAATARLQVCGFDQRLLDQFPFH